MAVLEALELWYDGGDLVKNERIDVYTDNMAVLYLLRKGSCSWDNVEYIQGAALILRISYLKRNLRVYAHYIRSENNPADALSRLSEPG